MFLLHRVNGWLGVRAQEIRLVHEDIEPFPGLILMMMMLTVVMEMVIIMIANIHCIFTMYQVQFYGLIHQMPRINVRGGDCYYPYLIKLVVERYCQMLTGQDMTVYYII